MNSADDFTVTNEETGLVNAEAIAIYPLSEISAILLYESPDKNYDYVSAYYCLGTWDEFIPVKLELVDEDEWAFRRLRTMYYLDDFSVLPSVDFVNGTRPVTITN